MNTPNIQSMLSRITTEQLKTYLISGGWRDYATDGRLNFEKDVEPGETQVVFIPANCAHPKFRSFLHNVMFSLSVIEKREPFDIATDIASIKVPERPKDQPFRPQLYEIASMIRGLSHVCIDTEQARGKLLELAKYLVGTNSLTITMSPFMADRLWEISRSDTSYLASKTMEWLEANTHGFSSK